MAFDTHHHSLQLLEWNLHVHVPISICDMTIVLDSFELFVTVVLAPKLDPYLWAISNWRCNLGARPINSPIIACRSPFVFGPWSCTSSRVHILAPILEPFNQRLSITGFTSMHNMPQPLIAHLPYVTPSLPHICHLSPCE